MVRKSSFVYETNDLLKISLVYEDDLPRHDLENFDAYLDRIAYFQPNFTYTIYGMEQIITCPGVNHLNIRILFSGLSHHILCCTRYSTSNHAGAWIVDKDEILSIPEINCVFGPLERSFLKDQWVSSLRQFRKCLSSSTGCIPKSLSCVFLRDDIISLEGSLEPFTAADLNWAARLQWLVPLFIEGGVLIDLTDSKWRVSLMYACNGGDGKRFIGFVTYYPFLYYPDKIRMRISQFLILPSFAKKGFGTLLYDHLMQTFRKDSEVKEITVEDPNEAFDGLRTKCDITSICNLICSEDKLKNLLMTSKKEPLARLLSPKLKLPQTHLLKVLQSLAKEVRH